MRAALRTRALIDPKSKEKNLQDLIRTLALEGCGLEDAVTGMELMETWKAEKKYRDDYIAAAHARWPEASAFQGTPN